MKTHPMALAFLACAAAFPALAQKAIPACEIANYDSGKNVFTISSAAPAAVSQQCLLTIHAARAATGGAQGGPAGLVEGRYTVLLSGGGGGGTGGENWNRGGGSGGAGAVPNQTVQFLSANVYKLTIGTGGEGGKPGGASYDGNLTSMSIASTGAVVAGHPDPDGATQLVRLPQLLGGGGAAQLGGSSGGNGADTSAARNESAAQAGGASQTAGYPGVGGPAGAERQGSSQAVAGGGGGAGVGNGGAGESAEGQLAGGAGDLGGGGGGGRGGNLTAHAGGRGGHGFIRLTKLD